MHTVVAQLVSISPYSQSRAHFTAKHNQELAKDYEARTWRGRMHTTEDGHVFIPPMAFKNSLSEAAKFLSMQIPGKNKSTYTKHFEAGVLVFDPLVLPILAKDVHGEWLFVPSDGKRGGGSRVERCFPLIRAWEGQVTYHILDDTITQDVFARHLTVSGGLIGIGRFRPRNNGFYGRFEVKGLHWE